MNWFYESGGKQNGPVSEADLDLLLARGAVTPDTLVWREGLPDWQPLRQARPAAAGGEGLVRCASCGEFKPAEEIVQIGQRPICATCKPAVLIGLQQGTLAPELAGLERSGPAWEERDRLGFFPALFRTMKSALTEPNETFLGMKREGGLGAPLLFYVITAGAGFTVYLWTQIVRFKYLPGSLNGNPGMEAILPAFTGIAAVFACMLIGPLLALCSAFVYAGVAHVSLMICGGAKQPFETTFRAFCYGYGSGLGLYVIPVCGMFVGGIWGIIAFIIGIARGHEIHGGRATLAVLLPMLVCCVGGALFAVAMVGIAAAGHH